MKSFWPKTLGQSEQILNSFSGNYTTRDFTNKALEKIDEFDSSGGNFLVVSYNAPHFPYILPKDYDDVYKDQPSIPFLRRNCFLLSVFVTLLKV